MASGFSSLRPRLARRSLIGLGLLAVASTAIADAAVRDPENLLADIRSAAPDLDRPLDPAGLRLATGFATLDLTRGVLIPVRTRAGMAVEMVFIGHGRARFEPPDEIEGGQLELFTGASTLSESFSEAVFVVGRDAASTALLERPAAPSVTPELRRQVEQRYAEWRESPERGTLGVDAGILLDALGDPVYEDYFAGWFLGDTLGSFLLSMDPTAEEQISLGQFVRVDASPEERESLNQFLHRQQKRGRLVGLELEDLGRWDSWVLSPLRAETGAPRPGSAGFEPIHYELDVTVDPRTGGLLSKSRITLQVLTSGRRMVSFELHRDLQIEGVYDGAGTELFYMRRDSELQILFSGLPERNSEIVVEVDCRGDFLEHTSDKGWALRDTLGWYPRTGPRERATYDVTLRWPKRYELVSSGREIESGEDGGMRWQRRAMEVPTLGFSFEVGHFEIATRHEGNVKVTVAMDPGTLELAPEDAAADLALTVANTLRFYEEIFGPYPLDELTVVTVPRQFSQAMLGFITLSGPLMADWGNFGPLFRVQDRASVVAHEVAHQWWGHLVGWHSYRDQWISEAMANYSALLWARHHGLDHAVGPITGWQQELTATVADGRPLESLGPLVLGERLFSSRSQQAYQAIVYRKGALVLEMLARKFGEEGFLRALKALVGAASGHVISTSDFLSLLERITDTELDGFARQFIYGTGLPEIYYDYGFEQTEHGKWRVRIEARQEMPSRLRYAVVQAPDGRLDVTRSRVEHRIDVDASELVVPFQILLAADPAHPEPGDQRPTLVGRMVISGRDTELEFEIDRKPAKLWLDRDREIFGRFLDRRLHPKRMLLQQAMKQVSVGDLGAAEEVLRKALSTRSPLASMDHLLDAHIYLQLATVQVDSGADAAATVNLDFARDAFESGSRELPRSEVKRFRSACQVLEARIEIRAGAYERAFQRLRGGVLDRQDVTSTEGYLLLAIAARNTGRQAEVQQAIKVARLRGADVSPLRSALAVVPATGP